MSFVFMRVRLTIIDETDQIVNLHFIMRATQHDSSLHRGTVIREYSAPKPPWRVETTSFSPTWAFVRGIGRSRVSKVLAGELLWMDGRSGSAFASGLRRCLLGAKCIENLTAGQYVRPGVAMYSPLGSSGGTKCGVIEKRRNVKRSSTSRWRCFGSRRGRGNGWRRKARRSSWMFGTS